MLKIIGRYWRFLYRVMIWLNIYFRKIFLREIWKCFLRILILEVGKLIRRIWLVYEGEDKGLYLG